MQDKFQNVANKVELTVTELGKYAGHIQTVGPQNSTTGGKSTSASVITPITDDNHHFTSVKCCASNDITITYQIYQPYAQKHEGFGITRTAIKKDEDKGSYYEAIKLRGHLEDETVTLYEAEYFGQDLMGCRNGIMAVLQKIKKARESGIHLTPEDTKITINNEHVEIPGIDLS